MLPLSSITLRSSYVKKLGIKIRLSAYWHLETDSEMKWLNRIMLQYLRTELNLLWDDWPNQLLLASFVGKNTQFETTKVTPFFVNKEFHPWIDIGPIDSLLSNIKEVSTNYFTTRMKKSQEILQDHLLLAWTDKKCHTK